MIWLAKAAVAGIARQREANERSRKGDGPVTAPLHCEEKSQSQLAKSEAEKGGFTM